jgi:hypothetical protein
VKRIGKAELWCPSTARTSALLMEGRELQPTPMMRKTLTQKAIRNQPEICFVSNENDW